MGAIYGLLARPTGIQETEALLMSLLVHAGTVQMVVLGLWNLPMPVVGIMLTTFLVNLRHVLSVPPYSPGFVGCRGGRYI
jgi:predicted branched-subunit amino acid permease